jgi:hypothetical protein
MGIKWREYVIQPKSYETKPKGWIPEARVILDRGAQRIEQELLAPDGVILPTKEDADKYAVGMAVQWVDKNYPPSN